MHPTIRVFLADKHDVYREGFRSLLGNIPPIEIVGLAASDQELLTHITAANPHVLLLDSALPGGNMVAFCNQLKEQLPDLHLVVLYGSEPILFIQEVLATGIQGMLPKTTAAADLARAVVEVREGRNIYDPAISGLVCKQLSGHRLSLLLNNREQQVLQLICAHHTTRQIAALIHLSENTIEDYRKSIFRKCAVRRNTQLIRFALQNGMIGDVINGL